MTITIETYQNALDDFLSDLGRMGDDVVSVFLFGSMARGEVRPGHSDIMDAMVFLMPEFFEERERFLRGLGIMVEISTGLAQRGLLYHPFNYWADPASMSAMFLPPFRSERSSKIFLGEDIRPLAGSTPESFAFARQVFFEARRRALQMAYFLCKPELTEEDCQYIRAGLINARKYFPMFACMALDIWVGESEIFDELKKALPGVDMSAFDQIKTVRDYPERPIEAEELRGLVRRTFVLIENLHDQIIQRRTGRQR
jgi:predicted nucleotidyltransferase